MLFFGCVLLACSPKLSAPEEPLQKGKQNSELDDAVEKEVEGARFPLLKKIIAQETWRQPDRSNESATLANLENVKNIIWSDLEAFNAQQSNLKFVSKEWKKRVNGSDYWVFAFRMGTGENLVSLLTHLDTVAPGSRDWRPFELREEQRAYPNKAPQTFLVGRGAIDDKGAAAFAIEAVKKIAKDYDLREGGLGNTTIELLFDTSEETGMSMPKYFDDCPSCEPSFGIVFDSKWCVRAEKGIERPLFFVDFDLGENTKDIRVTHIDTFNNPSNQIPGRVIVKFESANSKNLADLKMKISDIYQGALFDDPKYQKAKMNIVRNIAISNVENSITNNAQKKNVDTNVPNQPADDVFEIEFHVAGAQHGSVPDKNREHGANPLVSALNLIDLLAKNEKMLAENSYTRLAAFSVWAWGTKVLGEAHESLFAKADGIFEPSTTYAVTKLERKLLDNKDSLVLAVDIRFGLAHHAKPWSGQDGVISGDSRFQEIFTALTQTFQAISGTAVGFNTRMAYAPDIRNPDNHYMQTVNKAFKKIIGKECPMAAIGGGTDAKGRPNLVAVGPLFDSTMGYPVNYHGLNEAAPLDDLIKSRDILIEILKQEIESHQP